MVVECVYLLQGEVRPADLVKWTNAFLHTEAPISIPNVGGRSKKWK